jgi:hypothetical protein
MRMSFGICAHWNKRLLNSIYLEIEDKKSDLMN